MPILSSMLTEILIPLSAFTGIVFAFLQRYFVSFIPVSITASSSSFSTFSYDKSSGGYLLQEGPDGPDTVLKCAEIQESISLGMLIFHHPFFFFLSSSSKCSFFLCKFRSQFFMGKGWDDVYKFLGGLFVHPVRDNKPAVFHRSYGV